MREKNSDQCSLFGIDDIPIFLEYDENIGYANWNQTKKPIYFISHIKSKKIWVNSCLKREQMLFQIPTDEWKYEVKLPKWLLCVMSGSHLSSPIRNV